MDFSAKCITSGMPVGFCLELAKYSGGVEALYGEESHPEYRLLMPLIVAIMVVLIGYKILVYLFRKIYGVLFRLSMKFQGVETESMRPGSYFVQGEIPKYQVSLCKPGLLGSAHQGFGIRYGNYLVTPSHVIRDARAPNGDIVMKGPEQRRVLVSATHAVPSRNVSDLVYIYFPSSVWTTLGSANAKFSESITSNLATVTGFEGTAMGRVAITSMFGMVSIDASTVAGMSGAPYVSAGKVVGLHIGATGTHNVGVTAKVIKFELAKLISGESSETLAAEYVQSRMTSGKTWTDHIEEQLSSNWVTENSWADEGDEDESFYLRDLGYESASKRKEPESAVVISNYRDLDAVQKLCKKVGLKTQGVTSTYAEVVAKTSPLAAGVKTMEIVAAIQELDARVSRLEGRKVGVAAPPTNPKKLPAKAAAPKRAVGSDTPAPVKTVAKESPVLVRESKEPKSQIKTEKDFRLRPASEKRNGRNSNKVSNSSHKSHPSPAHQSDLSKILDSQRAIQSSLESLARAISGLSSAATPN